jgi:hypothetical protein
MKTVLCVCVYQTTTDPEARVRFPALPEKNVVGLERGALSLVEYKLRSYLIEK